MKCLHVPKVNLSAFQKGVYYMCIKGFNTLPNWIADLVQNEMKYLGKLKSVLMMEESFYSVIDFLDYCGTL